MLKTELIVIPFLTLQIFSAVNEFHRDTPQPANIKEEAPRQAARVALEELGAPKERMTTLTRSVYAAHVGTGIDPILIAAIIPKESEFKIAAKSKLGYKSLMQTKKATMDWNYAESNVMEGACTLREKLIATKGNMDRAMVYFKGHGGKESQIIAADQMKFYRNLRDKVTKRIEKENELNGGKRS